MRLNVFRDQMSLRPNVLAPKCLRPDVGFCGKTRNVLSCFFYNFLKPCQFLKKVFYGEDEDCVEFKCPET